jgi:hypothetical protein
MPDSSYETNSRNGPFTPKAAVGIPLNDRTVLARKGPLRAAPKRRAPCARGAVLSRWFRNARLWRS